MLLVLSFQHQQWLHMLYTVWAHAHEYVNACALSLEGSYQDLDMLWKLGVQQERALHSGPVLILIFNFSINVFSLNSSLYLHQSLLSPLHLFSSLYPKMKTNGFKWLSGWVCLYRKGCSAILTIWKNKVFLKQSNLKQQCVLLYKYSFED